MAGLKGSTSENCSAIDKESREIPKSTNRIMYLIAQSRSWTAKGNSNWRILSLRAPSLINSCRAPKGHSQPQKTPRPKNRTLAAVDTQRIKMIGSVRNSVQWKSCTRRSEEHTSELQSREN